MSLPDEQRRSLTYQRQLCESLCSACASKIRWGRAMPTARQLRTAAYAAVRHAMGGFQLDDLFTAKAERDAAVAEAKRLRRWVRETMERMALAKRQEQMMVHVGMGNTPKAKAAAKRIERQYKRDLKRIERIMGG